MLPYRFLLPLLLATNTSNLLAETLFAPDVGAYGLGRPGISTEFGFSGPADAVDHTGTLDSAWISLNLPVYKWDLAEGILAVGLNYDWQRFDWNGPTKFAAEMHRTGVRLSWIKVPEQSGLVSLLQGGLNVAGASGQFGSNDVDALALGILGWQFSPTFTLAAAFYLRWEVQELDLYPGVGIVWRPNPKWLLFLSPPAPSITYAISEDLRVSLAAWPYGSRWEISDQGSTVTKLEYQGMRVGVTLEQDLTEHLSLGLRGGLNFSQDFSLRGAGNQTLVETELDKSWFVALGVQWSF